MDSHQIITLGTALGLNYPKLLNMKYLPNDMVASWLRQEDRVPEEPPTWGRLIRALRSIDQNGIANTIEQDKYPQVSI